MPLLRLKCCELGSVSQLLILLLFFTFGLAFESFKEFEGASKELEVLGVDNHKFYFDVTQNLSVVLDFFNKTWDYAIIYIHVFNNAYKHKLLHSMFICRVNFL
jgi:hypothetical protein